MSKTTIDIVRTISNRLFETRKRGVVKYRPYNVNIAEKYMPEKHLSGVNYAIGESCCNLYEIFPDAQSGDYAIVEFNVSSNIEKSVILRITSGTVVSIDDELWEQRSNGTGYDTCEFTVNEKPKKISVRCTCLDKEFGFSYLVSTCEYTFMWGRDYLIHIRQTIPIKGYEDEEGIAVSRLYSKMETVDKITYVFPKKNPKTNYIDFMSSRTNEIGRIGYAYSEVNQNGELTVTNFSPIRIFVNGNRIEHRNESGDVCLSAKKGDKILIKSLKTDNAWGFSCDDSLLELKKLSSMRDYGDKWIVISGFGSDKEDFDFIFGPELDVDLKTVYRCSDGSCLFWRLSDGSYIRPELDTSFFGQWFYANMVGHYGILKLSKVFGASEYERFFSDSMQIMVDNMECIQEMWKTDQIKPAFLQRSLKLDHMDPIGTIGMNFAELYYINHSASVLNALYKLKDAYENNVPKDEDGVINRVETMWSDDLYMSVPFLSRLGSIIDEKYFDEAYNQLKHYFSKMYMENINVFSHIYYVKEKTKSEVPWGRGNGWVIMALCEFLDCVPKTYKYYCDVVKLYQKIMYGILAFQDDTGLWHQVLNKQETYLETSCSAMFLYGLLKGYGKGFIKDAEENIELAYNSLIKLCIDKDGNIKNVCMGSGCSRDWKTYAKLKTIENDDHGTGIAILALCEYIKYKNKGEVTL